MFYLLLVWSFLLELDVLLHYGHILWEFLSVSENVTDCIRLPRETYVRSVKQE